jgi:hypothetical protein
VVIFSGICGAGLLLPVCNLVIRGFPDLTQSRKAAKKPKRRSAPWRLYASFILEQRCRFVTSWIRETCLAIYSCRSHDDFTAADSKPGLDSVRRPGAFSGSVAFQPQEIP